MPYINPHTREYFADGLYLIKQFDAAKGVDHVGIFDVGNCTGLSPTGFLNDPVVIHHRPLGFRVQTLAETGAWKLVHRLKDQPAAAARIREIRANPATYSIFGNNCEHFTEYVEHGVRQSPQLQRTFLFGLGAMLLVWGLASFPSTAKARGPRSA